MRRRAWWIGTVVVAGAVACGSGTGGPSAPPRDAVDAADLPADAADAPAADAPDAADLPSDAADAPADAPVPDAGPGFDAWAAFDDPPPLSDALRTETPYLADLLAFRYHWKPGTPRPEARYLPDFAVGNGRTFAEFGLAFPLNTIHGMVGPTYGRRERFYGDLSLRPGDADGTAREFDEEWIATARAAPLVVAEGRRGDLHVVTVDVAPYADGTAFDPMQAVIWRLVRVRNDGAGPSDAGSLVVTASLAQVPADDALVETTQDGTRVTYFTTAGATASASSLVLPLPSLPAGGTFATDLVLATAAPGTDAATVRAALASASPQAWIATTATACEAWEASTTQVHTPDPIVDDTFVNLRRMLWQQVSAQGASSPMSRYTMAWTRDLSGVVRPLLALGAIPLARRVMDYYYAVAAQAGVLVDAYEADVDVDLANPPAVDWESLPPLEKKAQAEGPSYLAMMYDWLYRATGATDRAAARIGYLRHALFAQALSPDFLLPFSGDETYRASMNVAVGLDLEYEHHLKSWSLSSGMLFATAARGLADLEDALGNGDASQHARDVGASVEAATRAEYYTADGCIAAFVTKADGKVWPPHEDAILTGTWGGAPWDAGDDLDRAVSCLLARVHDGPGAFQSPMAPEYQADGILGLYLDKGLYTGMLPGYTLRALTDAGHPEAQAAFDLLRASMSPSGNYPEYSIADDHSALEILYDPSGGVGDYTARYRPWEGGINLEAAFHYLAGFEPDAPAARVRLRPHLPPGWPSMSVAPLVSGDTRLRLDATRDGDALRLTVTHLAGPAVTVTLVHDAYDGALPAFTLDTTPIPAADVAVETHFGTAVATLPDCALAAGGTCAWGVGE